LPPETPFFTADGIALFADPENAASAVTACDELAAILKAHLAGACGDYVALLAYIERNAAHAEALQRLRRMIRDRPAPRPVSVSGPRFLHSTGQASKGGPKAASSLQITGDDSEDLPVPGQRYTFGVVKAAQARGDFDVLAERERRLLRVHLPADLEGGLSIFAAALEQALQ
jgi:transaldolase/glucose-6-phosphate isomerase